MCTINKHTMGDQCITILFSSTQQTKVYQYTCHHCMEAHGKLVKSKERVDSIKNPARRKKAEEKEKEVRISWKLPGTFSVEFHCLLSCILCCVK